MEDGRWKKNVEKEAVHRERRWGQCQKKGGKNNECGDGQVERRVKSLGEGTARGTINVNTIGESMRVKNSNHIKNRSGPKRIREERAERNSVGIEDVLVRASDPP